MRWFWTRAQRAIAVLVVLALAAPVATAQSRGVIAGKEAEAWAGVGILRVAGGGFCSATLIDPVTVLTAAHCLYPQKKRILADPAGVRFNAGWREGISAAERQAVRITAHRDYDPTRAYGDKNIAADIALVTLDSPIPVDAAGPFKQLDRIRVGEAVANVSFSGRRSDVASINESCAVENRDGDILILSCETFPGMSGSPVFGRVNGQARIVALVSGTRQGWSGQNNGIALAIRAPLRRVKLDMDATATIPAEALPYWTRRSSAPAASRAPVATRKKVTVGSGLSNLTGSGGGRKVVKPPKSTN